MLSAATSEIDTLTSYCKATADQLRLSILRVLSKESFGVLELCQILEVAQPALSHHLKVLHTSGLVETRRQGNSIYYRRAIVGSDDPIRDLRQSLFNSVDGLTLAKPALAAMENVHEARKQQAKQFFQKNADLFKNNQDLIAEFSHYSSCINELLDNTELNVEGTVVEVGPGESPLILELTKRFGPIIAIDNNTDMLQKTEKVLAENDLEATRMIDGELSDYEGQANLIVANMVLHHLASPARFFQEASRKFAKNGTLLIADLTAHDQDWTREACGDLWQGFEPEELDRWALASEFELGQSAYLGLKNGFQVQVRLFHKHTKE